jgi:hypothetical protein
MLRLAIIDQDGKIVSMKDVPTAAELATLAEQARNFIRESERVAQQKVPKGSAQKVLPYST